MAAFTDSAYVQTTFIRNGFGEVTREISPDRGTTNYTYDLAGDVIRVVDGRGARVDYIRDILGRVTRKRPVGQASTGLRASAARQVCGPLPMTIAVTP